MRDIVIPEHLNWEASVECRACNTTATAEYEDLFVADIFPYDKPTGPTEKIYHVICPGCRGRIHVFGLTLLTTRAVDIRRTYRLPTRSPRD